MVRVDPHEVVTLAQKELEKNILWMTSTEQKMLLLIDYEKNLTVTSIKCLFLDVPERISECALFFGPFKLIGNVEPFVSVIGSVLEDPPTSAGDSNEQMLRESQTQEVLSIQERIKFEQG